MPKLRRMFPSVSAPFCWPTKTMGRPSKRAKPATMAGSSRKRRSPCSSTTSVAIRRSSSSVCGRLTSRACLTRSQACARASSVAAPGAVGASATAGLTLAATGQEAQRVEAAQAGDAVARRGPGADALLRRAQVPEQQREAIAQLVARHNLVHEAVLEEELGALEAGRQRFGDRAGGHAGPGKADERVRLGQGDVPEGGGGGEGAPPRRGMPYP